MTSVDGMNGLDFKGKTVGPVYFETACNCPLISPFLFSGSLQNLQKNDSGPPKEQDKMPVTQTIHNNQM